MERWLEKGDIIKLDEGDTVNAQLPTPFFNGGWEYGESRLGAVSIGDSSNGIETKRLAGEYVVVGVLEGERTPEGHGAGYYTTGRKITANKIDDGVLVDFVVTFYQGGDSFPQINKIEPIGKAHIKETVILKGPGSDD